MDGGAWKAAVHGVAEGRTRLSNFPFTFHFHALEKEIATHSSVLAWRIPGTGEPGGLPSMGSHRVGHDWNDLAVAVREARMVVQDLVRERLLPAEKFRKGFIEDGHVNCIIWYVGFVLGEPSNFQPLGGREWVPSSEGILWVKMWRRKGKVLVGRAV